MDKILTISSPAIAEFTEKKSRFIGQIAPADDEDSAKRFVEDIRRQQKGARHNVYAWIAGDQNQFMRSSDDGEPAGTGGRPVLESIKQAGLHNVVLVVTRYFGGILLGAGGLTRAYARAAQLAIDDAAKIYRIPAAKYALTVDYPLLSKTETLLASAGAQIKDRIYGEQVYLIYAVAAAEAQPLLKQLQEISLGSASWQELDEATYLEQSL